jgi:hypothetical protein
MLGIINAECRECIMLSVIMLSVVMWNVIMLSVAAPRIQIKFYCDCKSFVMFVLCNHKLILNYL